MKNENEEQKWDGRSEIIEKKEPVNSGTEKPGDISDFAVTLSDAKSLDVLWKICQNSTLSEKEGFAPLLLLEILKRTDAILKSSFDEDGASFKLAKIHNWILEKNLSSSSNDCAYYVNKQIKHLYFVGGENLLEDYRKHANAKELVRQLVNHYFSSHSPDTLFRIRDFRLANKTAGNSMDDHRSFAEMIMCFDAESSTNTILEIIRNHKNSQELKFFMLVATDLVGVEAVRERINALIEKESNEESKKRLETARTLLTPNHDKIAIENLRKFYEQNFRFEEYEVNQKMSAVEVDILEGEIQPGAKALEMGCGTGRLIVELSKRGRNVVGYDLTERHVKKTKEYLQKAGVIPKVFQGDWHNTGLSTASMDVIYSLGRNILHDYSFPAQVQLFREAARVLKPGGKFVFDIPNRETGSYKKMVGEYAREMKERGVENFRYGAIYDSPDGVNFATRYAYSHEDIEELAKIAGFEIVETKKLPLETGAEDENIYFILKKLRYN